MNSKRFIFSLLLVLSAENLLAQNIQEINSQTIDNSGQTRKKAFITGITGQDGSYLAELLLKKGYEVHGLVRRSSTVTTDRLKENTKSQIFYHYGDVTDSSNMTSLLDQIRPDEIYNLAAQSDVGISFKVPEYTTLTDALGPLIILDSIKTLGLAKKTRYYQASTSELFGQVQEIPQTERTPFYPRSPYGVAKLYGHWITVNYRESYGIFAVSGILFNHESPRRGENFVTRKITRAITRMKYDLQETLSLGNLDSKRDWGFAGDYVEAMWLMLQQEHPQDFIISTGESHSVREFIEIACKAIGMDIVWQGEGVEEKGIDRNTGKTRIVIDPQFYRPAEVNYLIGNPVKSRKLLNWHAKTNFKDLVLLMVESDLRLAKEEQDVKRAS